MKANFVSIGAASAALGILLGAFGAHGLHGVVGEAGLAVWETATRYWLVGALGMVLFGLFRSGHERERSPWPGFLLLGGSTLFSASLYALALGAPGVIGAVTPFGGLGLMAGFLSFAWSARKH
jgi:uncharacterized membrane protein YgdD (TMEM256/DUF423 family)